MLMSTSLSPFHSAWFPRGTRKTKESLEMRDGFENKENFWHSVVVLFLLLRKYPDKKLLRGERIYFSKHFQVIVHHKWQGCQGRNLKPCSHDNLSQEERD